MVAPGRVEAAPILPVHMLPVVPSRKHVEFSQALKKWEVAGD